MAKEIGYAARKRRERENNPREGDTTMKEGNPFVFKNGRWVKATPASQDSRRNVRSTTAKPKPTNNKPQVASIPPSEGTGGKAETTLKYGKAAPKPSPKTSPSASKPPAPTRSSTSSSSTPKPAGKVPSSTAGMKNQDKNFRGNPERKDSIASTLRELRGMGSGRKAAESKMSKPEDKSRYVAPDGRQYAGPAYGNGSKEQNGNNNSSTYTAQSDGAKKLQEAQKERAAKAKRDAEERAKKARERLTASASKKPGSTYG